MISLLTLMLLVVIFLIFYTLTGNTLPETSTIRSIALRFAVPAAFAAGFFLLAALPFGPLAGIPWAVLGCFMMSWIKGFVEVRRQVRLRALAADFVTAASGMFSAGQTAGEVVSAVGGRFAEPLGLDFRDMTIQYESNRYFSFHQAFRRLAQKHRLPEFQAVAAILEAAVPAGGPKAAGESLARLGQAIRQRDRLLAERAKNMVEVKFAGYVVVGILLVGILADATALREYYSASSGRLVAAAASAVLVGLIFAMRKLTQNKDLEGGV